MIVTLALRSLFSKPIRSAVLAGGFGLGVAVMAALLGIGGVILEQAKAPALVGGGDVVIGGAGGRIGSPTFVLSSVLGAGSLASQVEAAAPSARAVLYLVGDRGIVPVRARGGIPSLERALGDPETREIDAWQDTPDDRRWAAPDPGDVLREMDRFHRIPDVPSRAASWAEWLYFNGRADAARFYLTFLAGPYTSGTRRVIGVRLQLDRGGTLTSYSTSAEIEQDVLLAAAPEITVGPNQVRLDGREYRIVLDLPAERGRERVSGTIEIEDEVIRLENVNGQTAGGEVHVNGQLDCRQTPSTLKFQVAAQRLNLRQLPESWSLPPWPMRTSSPQKSAMSQRRWMWRARSMEPLASLMATMFWWAW